MRDVLLRQYNKYPVMQLQDAVKLIYQSEFGGGHMIENEAASLRRLKEEFGALRAAPASGDMFENIGGGICRLHLHALGDISLATVNRMFVVSANGVQGSPCRFEQKLKSLVQCCADAALSFDVQETKAYISTLKEKGYPAVGHSEAYRQAYAPAYRVIKAVFCTYFELFARIDQMLSVQDTVTVAIDGNSGAGKTYLGALLKSVYDCNVFPADHFFLSPEQKTKARLAAPGGNVDYERLKSDVIRGIRSGRPFSYRPYDCKKQAMAQPVGVSPKRLNIVEGCYSMHPALSGSYDLKVFLQIDPEIQKSRILQRDGAAMLERYIREWIPLENRFFTALDIRQRCDIVFNGV